MEDQQQLGLVSLEIEKGIAFITFFHPAHNAMPSHLLAELKTTIDAAGSNDAVKVLVLRSAGERTFCAGASFDELMSLEDITAAQRFFLGFAQVINAMRQCPKLIIGRVQGKAIGGGVGIAAATDYCLATSEAAIKLSELAVGIGPFVVGPAVARKIGDSAMSQLAIDATAFRSATWALEKGLYAQVFDTLAELDQATLALAQKLAASSPEAMLQLKKVFWEGTAHWDRLLEERAGTSGALILTDFARNAIGAFKQKN
jgi:methylglutaconyl-CoA hydratase